MTASGGATTPPTTSVLLPSNGATVSEEHWLDAAASSPVGIASVTFEVSGGSISDQHVGNGVPTPYGYIGAWDTRDVPNGTYTLQSVATDTTGTATTSAPITVTVNNGPLSTSVLLPASGFTLDRAQGGVMDAAASAGATSVSFELDEQPGNGLLGSFTATPTIYGWVYEQTPSPPAAGCVGTGISASIQSVATYPGGVTVTSPAVSGSVIVYVMPPPPPGGTLC